MIAYSLKHTYLGKVEISFTHTDKIDEVCEKFFKMQQIHVGSE